MSVNNQAIDEVDRSYFPFFLDRQYENNCISIKTKAFGEILVSEKQIFHFPDGVLGFDYVSKFAFVQEKGSPFLWMQACDEPQLAFIVIDPSVFIANFKLSVSQNDLDMIGVVSDNEIFVFSIVTIPENPSDMTANLQGPIVLNIIKNFGMQSISLNDKYNIRHKILDEMKKIKTAEDSNASPC